MADSDTNDDIKTGEADAPNTPSKNRRSRNYMMLALVLGLVGIIWVVTMLKLTIGAS
jgi:hypothetical protein|tara:strand:- start:80742 stop:80912 length:171 start_codon:yes stop_codon:yes gene_type:complete